MPAWAWIISTQLGCFTLASTYDRNPDNDSDPGAGRAYDSVLRLFWIDFWVMIMLVIFATTSLNIC